MKGALIALAVCVIASSGYFVFHNYMQERIAQPLLDASNLLREEYWESAIHTRGVEAARTEYLRMGEEGVSLGLQHASAHVFARALYANFGFEGVQYCGAEYVYGCFHEMIARGLFEEKDMREFSKKCVQSPLRLECEHGLGHGFVGHFGYTHEGVHEAMRMCEDMRALPVIQGCRWGVMMEYYFRNLEESVLVPIDRNGYEFCTEFSSLARSSCMYNLSTLWLNEDGAARTKDHVVAVGHRCTEIPDTGSDRLDCAKGIGKLTAYLSEVSYDERTALCTEALMSDTLSAECLEVVALYEQVVGKRE